MKSVLIIPDSGTMNLGDEIITQSCLSQIDLNQVSFKISSHQYHPRYLSNIVKDSDYLLMLGTNCISTTACFPWKVQLKLFAPHAVHTFKRYISKILLMGCGLTSKCDGHTIFRPYSYLFNKIFLSNNYIHSVRDEPSRLYLAKLGFDVLNTSCPTTWNLPKSHMGIDKITAICLSVTDYNKNLERDLCWVGSIDIFDFPIFIFCQGPGDKKYFLSILDKLSNREKFNNIIFIESLNYLKLLTKRYNFVHIGTRLHCSAFFWSYGMISFLIEIDQRSNGIRKNGVFPIISLEHYKNLPLLSELISAYELPQNSEYINNNILIYKKQLDLFK